MTVPSNENRRSVPRFQVWVACSVLPHLSDEDFREQAVLGSVRDLSREAISILLPVNQRYGMDASNLGEQVQMNLALPVGYVRLSATLVRSWPDNSGKHVFVFRIEDSKERSKYNEYLDSLESELLGSSKESLRSRLAIIETKLDPK